MPSHFYRLMFLSLIVAVFVVSAYVTFMKHSETLRLVTASSKTTTWAASELESDMLKFLYTFELYETGNRTHDEVLLRYELLWGRVNMLKTGDETQRFRLIKDAETLLTRLLTTLNRNEQMVLDFPSLNATLAKKIHQEFASLLPSVRQANIDSFLGPQRLDDLLKVHKLQKEFGFFLIGLLLSGLAFIAIILIESTRHKMQSLHDSLTGLPNRKYFNDRLSLVEINSIKKRQKFSIHIIDLNGFKSINDTYGHAAGDQLLKEVAIRLQYCISADDMVARLGGDEFGIIQEGINDSSRAALLGDRVCKALSIPFCFNDINIYPRASIGISLYPDDANSAIDTMGNADMAMYRAKSSNYFGYNFFDSVMYEDALRLKILGNALPHAIIRNELTLYYQSIVDIQTGIITGVEALIRWEHSRYGFIAAREIISVAEQIGQTTHFNEWVLKTACTQNKQWQDEGLPFVYMSVNVSQVMFIQDDLIASVQHALAVTGLAAKYLTIEITEDSIMVEIDRAIDILGNLKRLGVSLALGDFGTGYSSLSHMKELPVQRLKINHSFVQDLNEDPKDTRFITTILQLAQSLDLNVVAEGVETEQNRLDLLELGCHFGQGYLFAIPMPALHMTALLLKQKDGMA
ncbi:putative bifunctional diguanylate cyclase/phosphodiesterase [Neptunomonas antarctica]|nr:EAL domain-containing protein [Neptunomonas antarctica]